MGGQPLRQARSDGVLTLTLDRPEKRNALNIALITALQEALDSAAADEGVRVIVIRGAGESFCAGADLEALQRAAEESDPVANVRDAEVLGRLLITMRRHPRPIIAAVHGHALAGGAGLATACDLVVARDDAVFGYPEVHLGFVPAMVMALLRRTVGEKAAFELVARGERLSAAQAAELRLVNQVVDRGEWEGWVDRYAAELASRSASALTLCKRLLYGMDGLSFEEAIARGAEVNALARLTPDTRAGVKRFLERQDAR